MMAYADGLVGNILDKIDAMGISSNTVIFFTGDNGTPEQINSSFQGTILSGGKSTSDERGVRVPFYMRWDGVLPTNTTYSGILQFEDIAPTIAQICQVVMPQDRIIDGHSFYNAITGSSNAYVRNFTYMDTTFGASQNSKNTTRKLLNGTGLINVGNWPYGDIVISDSSQLDTIAHIQLEHNSTNRTIVLFGDRPWGGSTNEYIFSEE